MPDLPRFYCPDIAADSLQLTGPEAHHAVHVLRLRPGARVELFDGRGLVAMAEISSASRSALAMSVQSRRTVQRIGPVVQLAFAVPKGKRLDWLLEKATELGAAELRPVVFERSVAGGDELSEHKRDRWLGQCISAAKQSGLDLLPQIANVVTMEQYLRQRPAGLGLLGDLEADALSLRAALAKSPGGATDTFAGQRIDILIGPEGGVTPAERSAALTAGMLPVRIGSTTLRVETAAIALLAAVMAWSQP